MLKRVTLFIATNLLVVATVSILTSILGLHSYMQRYGIDYQCLIFFCLMWGMGGASIDNRATSLAAFKIAQQPSWLEIFSSHPPLEKRIARLENAKRV